ncbi:MAG TPA: VOC family protein [Rhizomicrobium sp.]|jgi:catechol 2,3-dioxygenase-like lactoylglutathione lyase family enzyme|nr:VOC family protein [Rhizomicrobium sp.]
MMTTKRGVRSAKAMVFALAATMAAGLAMPAAADDAPKTGRITGIGGVFFRSKDPKALAAWYRDVLGLKIEDWGGAALPLDAPSHPPVIVWSPFGEKSDYFAPSTREFMLNFAVDDLDAFLAMLKSKGVAVLKRDDSDPSGSFAWIVDPDGTKIELWQPKPK